MSEEIKKLGADLKEESIQRTKAADTHKAYDTAGYGYQYCVDRFNEVLGEQWGYDWDVLEHEKGTYSTGKDYHELTVRVSIWVRDKANGRACVGGHTSLVFVDGLKGAITNGFKKAAAFWGVGAKAYRGDIDDDNQPLPKGDKSEYSNIPDCPTCGKKLRKDKNSDGFYCWKKKGGCGATFDGNFMAGDKKTYDWIVRLNEFISTLPNHVQDYLRKSPLTDKEKAEFIKENDRDVTKITAAVEKEQEDRQTEIDLGDIVTDDNGLIPE